MANRGYLRDNFFYFKKLSLAKYMYVPTKPCNSSLFPFIVPPLSFIFIKKLLFLICFYCVSFVCFFLSIFVFYLLIFILTFLLFEFIFLKSHFQPTWAVIYSGMVLILLNYPLLSLFTNQSINQPIRIWFIYWLIDWNLV